LGLRAEVRRDFQCAAARRARPAKITRRRAGLGKLAPLLDVAQDFLALLGLELLLALFGREAFMQAPDLRASLVEDLRGEIEFLLGGAARLRVLEERDLYRCGWRNFAGDESLVVLAVFARHLLELFARDDVDSAG